MGLNPYATQPPPACLLFGPHTGCKHLPRLLSARPAHHLLQLGAPCDPVCNQRPRLRGADEHLQLVCCCDVLDVLGLGTLWVVHRATAGVTEQQHGSVPVASSLRSHRLAVVLTSLTAVLILPPQPRGSHGKSDSVKRYRVPIVQLRKTWLIGSMLIPGRAHGYLDEKCCGGSQTTHVRSLLAWTRRDSTQKISGGQHCFVPTRPVEGSSIAKLS